LKARRPSGRQPALTAWHVSGKSGIEPHQRDPEDIAGNQFFLDAATAVINPVLYGGFTSDYSPVQRETVTPGACSQIIKPDGPGQNSGSAIKIIVEVSDTKAADGSCIGNPIAGAAAAPNNITLAIKGSGSNPTLLLFCETPGSSNECFTPVNGQPGRYQANVEAFRKG
jgi:hypothetical protein